MDFNYLIVFGFSVISIDRRLVASRLSHTNVATPNYLLQLEIFVSKDQQLRAVHLILFRRFSKRLATPSEPVILG